MPRRRGEREFKKDFGPILTFADAALRAKVFDPLSTKEDDIDSSEFDKVVNLMRNVRERPHDDYLTRVRAALAKEGIDANDTFVGSHEFLFQSGFLRASDALERIKTPKDFLKLVTFKGENAPKFLNNMIGDFTDKHHDAKFFALNPSASDIAQLRQAAPWLNQKEDYVRRGLESHVSSADDYLKLTAPGLRDDEEAPDYVSAMAKMAEEFKNKLYSQHPSYAPRGCSRTPRSSSHSILRPRSSRSTIAPCRTTAKR